MRMLICFLFFLFTFGCATAHRINAVQVGMSKAEVIAVMGEPVSVGVNAETGAEFLNYRLSETDDDAFIGKLDPYFVKLIEGRVTAYGRMGQEEK